MKLERRIRERKVTRISLITGAFLIEVLACVVFSLFFFSTPQKAQLVPLYTVKTTSDTVVAGACTGNTSGCSLRGAIQAANATTDSIIGFAIPASDPFCSAGVCTINLTQALPVITKKVTISGPGPNRLEVRRSTGGEYRIFTVTATAPVTISGLHITNGRDSAGAGILRTGSGTVNVINCTVSSNLAVGISGSSGGGGITNFGGTVNVVNTTLNLNGSSGAGSTGGGAIHNEAGTFNLTNSTISNNTSGVSSNNGGGGIRNINGVMNVTNSTISRNTSPGPGGLGGGIFTSGGTVSVKSSIIALNTATTSGPDVIGTFVSAGFNLIGKRDTSSGFIAPTDQTGTIAVPLNPMLDPAGPENNGGPTPTIALLLGSPAIDKGSSNGLTGNLTTDQRGTAFLRTFDNRRIVNPAGGDGTDIGALERRESPYDFDGDGKTDLGIFRPQVGEWWYRRSSNGQVPAFQFGAGTDKMVPADYTGDGKTDIAFYRPSTGDWFVLRSENLSYFSFPFGAPEDIPVPADYDGDGKADPAVFRPSAGLWVIQRSSDNGTTFTTFGTNGDVPVAADYDGDGPADIAIFRPSVGQWWLNRTTAGVIAFGFGASTDKPVQGDYTGDGKSDVAFWRPSTGEWFVLRSENLSYYSVPFGITPDVPAPGDYDGDGKFDTTVFRPSGGQWFIQQSTAGTLSVPFGTNGDRPIPNAFVP